MEIYLHRKTKPHIRLWSQSFTFTFSVTLIRSVIQPNAILCYELTSTTKLKEENSVFKQIGTPLFFNSLQHSGYCMYHGSIVG
jgi:hypothetical protein